MKISKVLTSAVVATSLVGGIGLAVAQDSGTQNGSQSTQNVPANTAPQPAGNTVNPNTAGVGSSNMGSSNMGATNTPAYSSGSTTTNDTAAFSTERPAQADRN
ncbi:MAG: hypothetical protein Q7T87_01705 [Polaromonas sp.]|nr:hypothetical protein [Polaromonas sp.]